MSGTRGLFWLVPIALLVTGLLAIAATWLGSDRIEADLSGRTRAALGQAGLSQATVDFDGRDATVRDVPAGYARRAADAAGSVDGVRTVEVVAGESSAGPDGGERQRLQARLDELLAASPITFQPNTAVLTPQGVRAMSALVDTLDGSDTRLRFEVGGHVARVPGGDEQGARVLSRQRADAVAERLVAAGLGRERVTSVGYGDTRPLTPAGNTGSDRRVEITVK